MISKYYKLRIQGTSRPSISISKPVLGVLSMCPSLCVLQIFLAFFQFPSGGYAFVSTVVFFFFFGLGFLQLFLPFPLILV